MTTIIKTRKVVGVDGRVGRGVKISRRNFEKAASWSGGEALWRIDTKANDGIGDPRVKIRTKKGWRVARVDDVIVKWDKDDYTVIKAEDFAKYVTI